jgi:hypothetical protein|tara:strand:- start:106 stop:489 length:384 start_codon:yes stop_codon:yes gene_type:complete
MVKGVGKVILKKFKGTEDSKGKLGSMFSSDMMKLAEETKTIINKLKKGFKLTDKQKKDMERGIELHEQKAKQIIKEVEAPGSTTKVSNLNKLKEISKDGRKAYKKKSGGKLRGMGKALRGGGKVMRG